MGGDDIAYKDSCHFPRLQSNSKKTKTLTMSRYRLTMDEFLQLYGDVPEYRYLYDTRESKRDRNGNTEEVQEEIRRLSKEGRVKRRLSFWKTGSTASIPKTEPVSNAERSEDEGEDTEVFMEDKDNPVSKVCATVIFSTSLGT